MPEFPRRPTRRMFLAGAAAAGLTACAKSDPGPGEAKAVAPPTSLSIGGDGTTTAPATTAAPATSPRSSTTTTESTSSTSTSTTNATRPPSGPAAFFTSGKPDTGAIALTFHTDGDLAIDGRLLDVLAEHHAAMTSFVVGQWLDANPTWAKKLTDAGHELANHTYTHKTYAQLSPADMATEITKCRDTLSRLSGSPGRFFRPSGTSDGLSQPSAAVMKAATDAGYPYVAGWNVEPEDFNDPGSSAVRDRVIAGLKPGAIVSLHFGHRGTLEALPAILEAIAAKNLKPVTLSALIG